MRPSSGKIYYWRFNYGPGFEWRFGYCTYIDGQHSMVRMGLYNGDSTGGSIVSVKDIEWRDYV